MPTNSKWPVPPPPGTFACLSCALLCARMRSAFARPLTLAKDDEDDEAEGRRLGPLLDLLQHIATEHQESVPGPDADCETCAYFDGGPPDAEPDTVAVWEFLAREHRAKALILPADRACPNVR